MSSASFSENRNGLSSLRRLLHTAPPVTQPLEHCELCGEPLRPAHRHLLEHEQQTVLCVCSACSLLFEREGAGNAKYQLVPQRSLFLKDFQMSESEWDELLIPVNMAFLLRRTSSPVAAFYPGPAGATESLLTLDMWESLLAHNPILSSLEADSEALLINRVRKAREYYLVPIDLCYELVGLMRRSWRGLSGGEAVWREIGAFFTDLRARASVVLAGKDASNARPEL